MVNWNGNLLAEQEAVGSLFSRAFRYGDGVFESMLFHNGQLHFWEDHYFRLMAGMRILRMSIPLRFTPEFLEEEVLRTIEAAALIDEPVRVRLQVNRAGGGWYLPDSSDVDFFIQADKLEGTVYAPDNGLTVDIFKDHLKPIQLLSSIKSCNAALYITAAIWAQENELDDALLLNEKKQVIESVKSNLMVVDQEGKQLLTPSEHSGCLKGVMRKQVIRRAKSIGLQVVEKEISPFDLLKVREVWLTNSIRGVQWVQSYRNQQYHNDFALKMNESLRAQFH